MERCRRRKKRQISISYAYNFAFFNKSVLENHILLCLTLKICIFLSKQGGIDVLLHVVELSVYVICQLLKSIICSADDVTGCGGREGVVHDGSEEGCWWWLIEG